jgi:hypothetical protein
MHTIADEEILNSLVGRLRQLGPESTRHWGTLTAGEMLCHLGDANESVLGIRIPPDQIAAGAPRPFLKWFALYTAVPWPKGVKTRPGVDPKLNGTRPEDFEKDRERAIRSLKALAAAAPASFPARHFFFGPMSARDWHRWAYRHVTHHLRQFGL